MTLKLRSNQCLGKTYLVRGAWYKGEGRNSRIGLWSGTSFLTFGEKFGQYVEKQEEHWDDGGPFQPFERI